MALLLHPQGPGFKSCCRQWHFFMSKLSLRDDIEPDIGFTSLGSDIQQYSLAMPGMHAWHLKFHKSVLYNDIGILQRIILDSL